MQRHSQLGRLSPLPFLFTPQFTLRLAPVFSKKDMRKLDEYKAVVNKIAGQEKDLYNEYFKAHRHVEK